MAPILGYWAIRGLAQPIRLLLTYTGTEFEDVKYVCGEDNDRSSWFSVKYTLGLDFPNLPYYIDGDLKITQSTAILKHIARKNNLYGKTEHEMAYVDMMDSVAMDFRNGFVRVCYNPDYEKLKDKYREDVCKTIKGFDDHLSTRKFFAGDELTFVDFVFYELLDQHLTWDPSVIEPHKNIKEFLSRIEALPAIAEYLKSDKFLKRPINNPTAGFR